MKRGRETKRASLRAPSGQIYSINQGRFALHKMFGLFTASGYVLEPRVDALRGYPGERIGKHSNPHPGLRLSRWKRNPQV